MRRPVAPKNALAMLALLQLPGETSFPSSSGQWPSSDRDRRWSIAASSTARARVSIGGGIPPPVGRKDALVTLAELPRGYIVLVVATLVWGSVHPAVKFALSELTSVQLALLRPVCACIVLTALVIATGHGPLLGRELRATPGTLTALGVLGYAGSSSLAALALGLLPAGVTALISNSSPLIVVTVGLLIFHMRVGRPEIAGTLVGFGGVALLSAGDIQATGDLGSTLLGSGLALGSAACWAAYTALARRLGGADPLVTTALTSGIGALVVGGVALPTQDWSRLTHASAPVIASTLWAGAIATGCTYAAWSFALQRLPAITVAPVGYLIPLSALFISHVWLGEALTVPTLVGATLVLFGVALTQVRQLRLLGRAHRRTARPV
jgi:drug/metabolite transporter (DMT)-like permease